MGYSNYPKMSPEIIEAIHNTFVDNPDVEADCYVYLSVALCLSDITGANMARKALEDMGRCENCGEVMAVHEHKELHPEIGPGVYETLHEPYCPNCDIKEMV